jgi:hypothetical protein
VQRREVDAVLDLLQHGVIDQDGTVELLAAMNDAVAHGVDVGERAEAGNRGFRRDQPAQDVIQGLPVVAQGGGEALRRAALGVQGEQRLAADPLDQPAGQLAVRFALDGFEVRGNELELE